MKYCLRKNLLIGLFVLCCCSISAQETIVYSPLGDANDPSPRRYEIARIYIDVVNWNWSGTTEIDLHEKYYSAGLKKTYIVSYGYQVTPVCLLKDISGEGANHFKVTVGAEVHVAGTIKYLPIFVDLKYYSVVNVALKTNWFLTVNPSNTTQGRLYYNSSPSFITIPDFVSDGTAHISNRASETILAGNVGIGTNTPKEKLSVNGKIRAHEVKVETANWPDYVFSPSYKLPDLKETEKFIKANNHLPDIPSAAEVEKEGVNLGEMNARLLKKIEELTLYLIELKKDNEQIKIDHARQQQEINLLKNKR
jgi:hypothetical protein